MRGIHFKAHRPSHLATIHSGHLFVQPSSSAANNTVDEYLPDVSRKVSLSRTAERDMAYSKAYYQKIREALLLRQKEPDRREARRAYYLQWLQADPFRKEAKGRDAGKDERQEMRDAERAKRQEQRVEEQRRRADESAES